MKRYSCIVMKVYYNNADARHHVYRFLSSFTFLISLLNLEVLILKQPSMNDD